MDSLSWTTIIVFGGIVLLGFWVVGVYNGMITRRNTMTNALEQINVVLKQRHDTIPNLVATVKGYAAHESGTLEAVTQARAAAQQASTALGGGNGVGAGGGATQGIAALAAAEGALGQALGRLFAIAEAYPDLKASDNFRDLQEQLTSLENKVAAARRGYNNAVLDYNNAIHVFPAVVVARMFRFQDGEELVFADADTIAQTPTVTF